MGITNQLLGGSRGTPLPLESFPFWAIWEWFWSILRQSLGPSSCGVTDRFFTEYLLPRWNDPLYVHDSCSMVWAYITCEACNSWCKLIALPTSTEVLSVQETSKLTTFHLNSIGRIWGGGLPLPFPIDRTLALSYFLNTQVSMKHVSLYNYAPPAQFILNSITTTWR